MVKSSSAQISSNTLGWPWMTAYLLMSMHVLYIKSKVSKVLGVFSRLRLLICWLRKQQTGYTRWWCCQCLITDIVWRGSGKMNSFKLERMQRRAEQNCVYELQYVYCWHYFKTWLGPLVRERKLHILDQVSDCLAGKAPAYFQNYFKQGRSDTVCAYWLS